MPDLLRITRFTIVEEDNLKEVEKPHLTEKERFRQAEKVTIIGIVTNILLTAFKFFA